MENSATKGSREPRDDHVREIKHPEQVEKSFGLAGTIDEKYQTLLKKATDIEKDNKKLLSTIKLHEKRYDTLLREKENLQKENNKNVLMRTKLEQVCREQQKLLKSVQNESVKHKETQAKFQHSINEISVTLSKNNDENIKLKEDNIEMTKKLKYLAEQYQIREKQLEKINEQVQLESQLHDAKIAKAQMESAMEKEILLKEKQCALDELLKCKKSIQEMQKREELLKEQLGVYTSKYDDFQSSLQKSNDVFASYKTELEKMVKKTRKLEKESLEWKRKCERSTANLLDLATEKQVKDEYIAKTAKQMQQLQKLLRTLQAERTTLHKTLKDNSIEIPPMPVLPPEPEPVPPPKIPQSKQPDKMESVAKSCAELKQSLALLQDQMTALTTKQQSGGEQQTTEPPAKSKNKKSKSKNKSCSVKDRNQTEVESKIKEVDTTLIKQNGEAVVDEPGQQENPNDTCMNTEKENVTIEIIEDTIEPTRVTEPIDVLEKTDAAIEMPILPTENGAALPVEVSSPTSSNLLQSIECKVDDKLIAVNENETNIDTAPSPLVTLNTDNSV